MPVLKIKIVLVSIIVVGVSIIGIFLISQRLNTPSVSVLEQPESSYNPVPNQGFPEAGNVSPSPTSKTLVSGTIPSLSITSTHPSMPIFDITEKSIEELQQAMSSGQLTSVQLVQAYLKRIDAYNKVGPKIKAMVSTISKEIAIAQAQILDQERRVSGPQSNLHGIPVLVKDSMDVVGFPTTGGTTLFKDALPSRDAFIVAKLKNAGAIILGKTNLDELQTGAFGTSTLVGQSLNPYDLSRIPGGSSAGSGSGIAANFAAIGIGADTNGSIRTPSSYNNLFGLRPTRGLISRTGTMPGNEATDVLGPMTKNMTDLAYTLDIIVGPDAQDPATKLSVGRLPSTKYASFLNKNALRGMRIGYVKNFVEFSGTKGDVNIDPEVVEMVRVAKRVLTEFQNAGAQMIPIDFKPTDVLFQKIGKISGGLEVGRAKLLWDAYLPGLSGTTVRTLDELIAEGMKKKLFQAFGFIEQTIKMAGLQSKAKANYNYESEKTLYADQREFQEYMTQYMDSLGIDALLITPLIKPNRILKDGGIEIKNLNLNNVIPFALDDLAIALSSISGIPTLVLPAGFTSDGAPAGIQLVGRAFAEPKLISIGYSYEQATKHRKLPALTPPIP